MVDDSLNEEEIIKEMAKSLREVLSNLKNMHLNIKAE
jgi:hypothetical protein